MEQQAAAVTPVEGTLMPHDHEMDADGQPEKRQQHNDNGAGQEQQLQQQHAGIEERQDDTAPAPVAEVQDVSAASARAAAASPSPLSAPIPPPVSDVDEHLESCIACGGIGELLLCDSCPLVFHLRCTRKRQMPDGMWKCDVCMGRATLQEYRMQRQRRRERARAERRKPHSGRGRGDAGSDSDASSYVPMASDPDADHALSCAFCHRVELPFSSGVSPLPPHDPASVEERLMGPWREEDKRGGGGRSNDVYVHRACAMWSPRVFIADGHLQNVVMEVQRARGLTCTECRKRGASIGCLENSCPRTYHYPCAKEKAQACMLLPGYHVYCPDHAVARNLRTAIGMEEPLLSMRIDNVQQQCALRDAGTAAAAAGSHAWGLGDKRRATQGFYSSAEVYASYPASATAARAAKERRFAHLIGLPEGEAKRRRKVESRILSLAEEEAIREQEAERERKRRRAHMSSEEKQRDEEQERTRAPANQALAATRSGDVPGAAASVDVSSSAGAAATPASPWSLVGGLDSQIDALKECVLLPLLYPELFAEKHISAPKGVILVGPPGGGKTLLARSLAHACTSLSSSGRPVTFFARKGADVLSKFHGDAEQTLRALFDRAAREAPSIIFFDELDGLAPARSAKQNQVHSSVVTTLLALMDGLAPRANVFVLATTNRIDSIDPALRRPGRFDREITVGLPALEQRRQILAIHTRGWPAASQIDGDTLDRVAAQTSGFSGADLRALCSEAALLAAHRTLGPALLPSGSGDSLAPRRDPAVLARLELVRVELDDFKSALGKMSSSVRRHDSGSLEQYAAEYERSEHLDALLQAKIREAMGALDLPPALTQGAKGAGVADTLVMEEEATEDEFPPNTSTLKVPLALPSIVHRLLICDTGAPPPSRVGMDADGSPVQLSMDVIPRPSNPALLASALFSHLDLEGCVVRRLDIPSLLVDAEAITLEEACVRVFQAAQASDIKSDDSSAWGTTPGERK